MRILGIDPGSVSGAYALYDTQIPGRIQAYDCPVVAGNINGNAFATDIRALKPDVAVVELVGSMPHQGISSTFKFGVANGRLLGILEGMQIPYQLVTPNKWKVFYKVGANKEKTRALAIRTFPLDADRFKRKMDHNRADATFIACYGAEVVYKERAAASPQQ